MNITDEMVKTYRLGEHAVCVEGGSINAAMRAGLEAVAPLIAAQALRSAAEDVRDNDDAHSHGDFCGYGPPGTCDCERGITFRWLISRALGRCGAPNHHKDGYACHRDAGHVPGYDHRYGPVEPLPEQCCAAPNMVWEHSRDNKDHFRCHACGGGMTKARATS